MTETITAITSQENSGRAGHELGQAIRAAFHGATADAVILFASARHDYPRLLRVLADTCGTEVIVGSSSAGEFTQETRGVGHVSVLAIRSQTLQFAVGLGRNISSDPTQAATHVVEGFQGLKTRDLPYRAALVMTDALAGHSDALVEALTMATGGNYRFCGGGAGDDGRFQRTHVFAGTEALSDAVVALEILSLRPVGIGVSHGWLPAGTGLRVTEVDGTRLISLNGNPAVQAFEDHAKTLSQRFDSADPLPFFLHNILGIKSDDKFRLRVPLGVQPDGSIVCAAAIPHGAVVHIMKSTEASAVLAASQATQAALTALGAAKPAAAIVFDCVATRMRLGNAFDNELRACADLLAPVGFVGCNTYGQIARADGQFGGFHNCTAVVCVLPE